MSSKRQHLQCINGRYRFRRRWPAKVRSVAPGEYFIRHLGTSSLDEAVRLRPAAEIEFHSEIDRLARLVDTKPRDLSNAVGTIMVSRWFLERVRADEQYDLLNAPSSPEKRVGLVEGARAMTEVVSDMLGSGDLSVFEVHAGRLLAEQGISVDPGSPGFRFLSQLLARADKERHLLSAARLQGDFGYQPTDPILAAALKEPERVAPRHTVGTLIEAYKRDRADKWSPSSTAAYVPVERVMREVFGTTRELSTITRDDGRRLFEVVKLLPRGLGKHPKLRNLSVMDAIKTAFPSCHPRASTRPTSP